MNNLRLAFRSLLKSPLITTVAVLSLALGIGANAGIFSLFEQILLQQLPVQQPERLVNLESPGPKAGSQSTNDSGGADAVFSYPMFRDFQAAESVQEAFDGLAGHRSFGANLAYRGETFSAAGTTVSGNYFPMLGLRPALGRLLGPDDDQIAGAHTVAVLSYGAWRDRFGSDPQILDQTLVVNGHPLTVVGVAPEGFRGISLGQDPNIFVPLSLRETVIPGWEGLENRRSYWVYLFGRLAPGVTTETAEAALNGPYQSLLQEVEAPLQEGMSEATLARFVDKKILLQPGEKGQSNIYEEATAPLLLLLCVTGFVLLIACANLANLLLVRAIRRSGEIAVRFSLGAQRHQIVGQLLTESFLLAVVGAVFGLLVARGTLLLFLSMIPSDANLGIGARLGPSVWIFLAVLTVVTGLVGLFPALHTTRHDLATTLKGQGGRAAASRTARRFRAVMATVQIALSMALLVSAGLFASSLRNVSRVDLGIDTPRLATFGVSPELNGYAPNACIDFFARLEEEIRALPGVDRATASRVPLIAGSNWGTNVSVQGFDAGPDTDTHSQFNHVGPGYFRTLGIPLLSGREFELRDGEDAPQVAIVNEAFAKKFGLGRDAVGRRMAQGGTEELDLEIVGLVADAKYSEVKDAVPPLFFRPYHQSENLGTAYFYVRTDGDPAALLPSLRNTVARLDPNLPVNDLMPMTLQVQQNVFVDRMLTTLSTAFAVLATLLAAIGLYGVVAYSVAQRTREFGLRMALGADARRVHGLVLGQVGWMTLVGGVLGLVAALALGKLAGSLLFELEGHDPVVLTLSALALAAVALTAGLLPARRAARVDPMIALREE